MGKMYSDAELNLPSMAFSGREWADGTAQAFFRRQYREAVEARKKDEKAVVNQRRKDRKASLALGLGWKHNRPAKLPPADSRCLSPLTSQADIDKGLVKAVCLPPKS